MGFKTYPKASALFVWVLITAHMGAAHAQQSRYIPADKALYDSIRTLDSLVFDAFNARDIQRFQRFFSDSLVIYQDNTGVRDYRQSMEAFRGLFAGTYILTRTLVPGTLEVYPIKDYGAIETGQHTFCHMENGKPDCGTYKFLHIWEYRNGTWKVTRIVTYGH